MPTDRLAHYWSQKSPADLATELRAFADLLDGSVAAAATHEGAVTEHTVVIETLIKSAWLNRVLMLRAAATVLEARG